MATASYQHELPAFAVLYAVGCGLISALGFYNITQPASIRAAVNEPARAVVWLTVIGAFSSPIFLPATAALVNAVGWRSTIRVLAAIAAATFLAMAALAGTERPHAPTPTMVRAACLTRCAIAWKAPGFRRWVLASLISGAGVDIILVYQVPVMIAAGLSIGAAATIGGLRGFAQLGGRLPLSPLLRRLGARRTIVLTLIVAAVGTLLLLTSGHVVPAVLYSLLAGASIGAMYTLQGIYTNELVGESEPQHVDGRTGCRVRRRRRDRPADRRNPVRAPSAPTALVVWLTAAGLAGAAVLMSTATRSREQ